MHEDVNGLVIGVMNVREGDKFLTVLTDKLGKIKVNAKGAGKRGSRLLAASQLFACSKLTLFEKNGRYTIDSAQPLHQFHGLSADIVHLSLASYFAELLEGTTGPGADCGDILTLAVSALGALAGGRRLETVVKAAFEIRLMDLLGYAPEIDRCTVCGKNATGPGFFINVGAGVLHCGACRESVRGTASLPLTAGALEAVRFVLTAPENRIFAFSIGPDSMESLLKISEAYVLGRLERSFETLQFYKKMRESAFLMEINEKA